MLLQNKIIVITGGAGRLGQCFAKNIAEKGGIPIVADTNKIVLKRFVKKLQSQGFFQAEEAFLDITKKSSVSYLISLITKRHGKIDAVVNNAYPRNKNFGRKLEKVTYKDFCENVNLHLGGYFLVAQQFCLKFKTQGHGNLINIASIYGTVAPRFDLYKGTSMTMPVEYAAIKSAIVHLTKYFAKYYYKTGIRVNSLSPGGILAGQPRSFIKAYQKYCTSKGMLEAEDVAGSLLFLLSDESHYITGRNLVIDDGFSI